MLAYCEKGHRPIIKLNNADTFYPVKEKVSFPENDTYYFPRGKWVKNYKERYLQDFATFDIEATSFFDSNWFCPYGIMYHWQMCVCGKNFYGRYWDEFLSLIDQIRSFYHLDEKNIFVIFVHNLSYEWQFMKEFFEPIPGECWNNDKNKPVKIRCKGGIEFRCSYILTNMSLKKACENTKNVIHGKKAGDLDYSVRRLPWTPLTLTEKEYCFNDTQGLYEVCKEKLREEKNGFYSLPLTSTGYVRRLVKEYCKEDLEQRRMVQGMEPSVEFYDLLVKAIRGGNTHANRYYAGKCLENVASADLTSDYPYQMMAKYYPVTKFAKVSDAILNDSEFVDFCLDHYCCLLEVEFWDIAVKDFTPIPYLATAKCGEIWTSEKYSRTIYDNGRILCAGHVSTVCTELDFDIILRQYKYGNCYIKAMYTAERGKLPIGIRRAIMDLFGEKTKLKGIKEKKYEYGKTKNLLNAIYGMLCTNTCKDGWGILPNGDYQKHELTYEEKKKAIHKVYHKGFLAYEWSLYVTSHARFDLQTMIDLIGMDVAYCDTDSVKFLNGEKHLQKIYEYNDRVKKGYEKLDLKPIAYDRKGNASYMGTFDIEETCTYFVTWGAKKYASVHKEEVGYSVDITVAGCNKEKGSETIMELLGGKWIIEKGKKVMRITKKQASRLDQAFCKGRIFSEEQSGRTVAYRNSAIGEIEVSDCYHHRGKVFAPSNIGMVNTTYQLGITTEYEAILSDCGIEIYD